MTVTQLRAVGAFGLLAVASFVVGFLLDPFPPTAGASATTVLNHAAGSSGVDRTAAFLLALSATALVAFIAGVRTWLETISSAPRWWGAAMFGGAILTAASLLVNAGLFFLLASHAPPNAEIAVYLSDGVNYGLVFAGFGVILTVGFLAALMVTTGGPMALLGRIGVAVAMLQVLFLATAFFSGGPLVAGGGVTILGFGFAALFITLTAVSVLWFARLMRAAGQR
jgi:hypothetical protein